MGNENEETKETPPVAEEVKTLNDWDPATITVLEKKTIRVNRMNVAALVQTMEAQGKLLGELRQNTQVQARSLITMQNELIAMRQSLAQATAAMGTGPTKKV